VHWYRNYGDIFVRTYGTIINSSIAAIAIILVLFFNQIKNSCTPKTFLTNNKIAINIVINPTLN